MNGFPATPSSPAPSFTSLGEHVSAIQAGEHVLGAFFLKDIPILALADGTLLVVGEGEPKRLTVHPDAGMLVVAQDGNAVVSGGDDGRVVRTLAEGTSETLADENGRWIDALAMSGSGAVAWATGKRVTARDDRGRLRHLDIPSTGQGIAFAPKGYRLAVSHYNGASLWFPNTAAAPEVLAWKGSHLDVIWSPDGRFVITSMQENTLHGWRLPEKVDMRMAGYPSKTRSMSWSHDGEWLATSGADAAIVWPFVAKEGPMGKAPRECGVRPTKVSRVAFHPGALVLAIGYEDGFVMLSRLTDAAELLVRRNDPDSGAVTALAWDRQGKRLLFGTANGRAGVLALPA